MTDLKTVLITRVGDDLHFQLPDGHEFTMSRGDVSKLYMFLVEYLFSTTLKRRAE